MKKCIMIILLILSLILSGASAEESVRNLPTSNNKLTPGKLYNELVTALHDGNTEYFQQLVAAYPELAQQLQQRLRKLGQGDRANAEEYRTVLAELERAFSEPIAEDDIAIEHFWQEFLTAISADDFDYIQQLMVQYPHIAQETQQWLLDLTETGTEEQAEISREFAIIFREFHTGKVPEISDETKAFAGGIASAQFVNEFIDATEARDIEHLHQLVTNTPKTAEVVQQVLKNLADESTGEEAKYFQGLVEALAELRIGYMPYPDLDRLNDEGFAAYYKADYQNALEIWQTALNQAQTLNVQYYISEFLGTIGMAYRELGWYQQALESFEQALAITQKIHYQEGEASALMGVGSVCNALGKYRQALTYYEQALEIRRNLGDLRGEGSLLGNIGLVYENIGQYRQALVYHQQALDIHRQLKERRDEGINLNNIGNIYGHLGQHLQALEYYEKALVIHREIGDQYMEGRILNNIGNIYGNFGQTRQALEYQERALALYREIGSLVGEAHVIGHIGSVYIMQGQPQKALPYIKRALEMKRKLGDHKGEAESLGSMGLLYKNLGRYSQALEYFEYALTIEREIGNKSGEAATLNDIGEMCREQGQYSHALKYYEQALVIHRVIESKIGEAANLCNIGLVYDSLGQSGPALKYLEQALVIAREIDDKAGERLFLTNIGGLLRDSEQYQKALDYHREALALAREDDDATSIKTALMNIGVVYRDLSQYDEAFKHFEQVLAMSEETADKRVKGVALNNLGFLYALLKQYRKAYTAFQESITLHTSLNTHDDLWRAQVGLAITEVMSNNMESALVHFEQALDTIDQIRTGIQEQSHKLSFMQDKLYVYDELITLLQTLHSKYPDKGYDGKALEIFERKQGRLFLEQMGQSGARLFAGFPDAFSEKEIDLVLQIEQTRKQLGKEYAKSVTDQDKEFIKNLEEHEKTLLTEQQTLQEQIKTEYPDYYALKYPQPVSLAELQKNVLQSDELMLVYNVMDEKTIMWLIEPDTMQMYTLPVGEKELQERVTELRQAMELEWKQHRGHKVDLRPDAPKQKTFAEASYDLYTLLIPEEVYPLLTSPPTPFTSPPTPLLQGEGGKILNIIPTGPLYALPFEALVIRLPDEIVSQKLAMTPHYLVEDIPISYLSSASLLKTLREAQARRKATAPYPLLAFAHPVYDESPSPNPSHQGQCHQLKLPSHFSSVCRFTYF
jgi:tetratricopeptide (TPR) repeat protein